VRHKSESCWPHLKTRTTFWGWGGHLTSSKWCPMVILVS
jgi:hypothetical protein